MAEIVDGAGISEVEVTLGVHLGEGGLVLGPKVEAHVDEEPNFVFDGTVGGQVSLAEDGKDGDGGDRHLVIELVEGVQVLGEWGRPPQEVVPVFRSASEVDEFFWSRDKGGVVNVLFPILGVFFFESRFEVKGAKIFQNVIENLADVREGRVAVFMEEGGEGSDSVGLEDGRVIESVGGRHFCMEKVGEFSRLKKYGWNR